jgi:hypothetical protein
LSHDRETAGNFLGRQRFDDFRWHRLVPFPASLFLWQPRAKSSRIFSASPVVNCTAVSGRGD